MSSRALPILGLGVGALALVASAGLAPMAGAHQAHAGNATTATTGTPAAAARPHGKLITCFTQTKGDSGIAVVSQDFTDPDMDTYDSRGAADVNLPRSCHIKRIDVAGQYFNGSGPADSENVTVYRNLDGLPGGVVTNQDDIVGTDDAGSFSIDLTSTIGLRGKKYWVSVQANMAFSSGGEWGWETSGRQQGYEGAWRNKADGFGTGCVHYTAMSDCLGDDLGVDWIVTLYGSRPS